MSQDMWKDAPEWAMWAAMDSNESWYWFERKPYIGDHYFLEYSGDIEPFEYEPCDDWRESLTPRPDNYIDDMWPEWKQPESPRESQIGGNHYKDMPIQPIEYIAVNGLSFLQGSVVKYVSRYKAKGGLQDLEKAKHCIDLMIEFDYGNNGGEV
jgi:hypothetical protein